MASPIAGHDVFVSFRGEDTRDNFTSHLHAALRGKKIETFIDDGLERGDQISPALDRAIEGSKLSLVVFSKDYASSKWCLNELVKILECKSTRGQLVIPIFYRVEPADVRWQRGDYAKAFINHEERFKNDAERVQRWRWALTEAANLAGWDSATTRYVLQTFFPRLNESEIWTDSMLVDNIFKDVLKKLNLLSSKSDRQSSGVVCGGLVGIKSRVERVISLLGTSSLDFRMVGIWGMGGIGKTTVAEAVFNRIYGDFDGYYFLRNVKEADKNGNLIQVRDRVLSQLLGEENLRIGTSAIRPDFIKERLRRRLVLLILDDVDDSRQLETFFGGLDQFGAGSRVVVTTRDRQVLNSFGISNVYSVEVLDDGEALQLFRRHAFSSDQPLESYKQETDSVLNYARGIPLALKVLGSSLHGKPKQHWESALKKLKRVPNLKILDVLKVSYDGLEDEETKDIFLDIACFFNGEDMDDATRILDACYHASLSGIIDLIDKSLVTVSGNKIEMHDLLQELGWSIVQQECKVEPGKRSRVWTPEDVHHILARNTGTETVRGITVNLSKLKEVDVSPDVFEKMYNLKLIKFFGRTEVDQKIHPSHGLRSLPDQLRYLCWHGYPLKCLPSTFCAKNLVELDMPYSNVSHLWNGTQEFLGLKVINLIESKKLTKIPDLSWVTSLESMQLGGCESLVKIPSSIQHLSKLTELNLRDCKKLRNLPNSVSLRSLKTLDMTGCSSIDKFPRISQSVEYLSLSETEIAEVPTSIQDLCGLVNLRFTKCLRLKNLPSTLQNLASLQYLDLRGCKCITKLPDVPENIQNLYLEGTRIEELPSSIGCLSVLHDLNLRASEWLRTLPNSIWKLKSLEALYLSDCSNLETIPEVLEPNGSLTAVDLSGTNLTELPSSFHKLSALRGLLLDNCQKLAKLPSDLWNLKELDFFSAQGTAIEGLPPSSAVLRNLKYLYVSGCSGRKPVPFTLPPLSGFCYLDSLRLKDLHIVEIPEDICCLVLLEVMDLSGNEFEKLPASFQTLSKLRWLDLSHCRRLESLPRLPLGLFSLNAHGCTSLKSVTCYLEFLRTGSAKMHDQQCHAFTNCFNLPQNLSSEVMRLLGQRLQEQVEDTTLVISFPESQLPQLLNHQCAASSMTMQLPSCSFGGKYVDYALWVVIAFEDYYDDRSFLIRCEYDFKTNGGDRLVGVRNFWPQNDLLPQIQFIVSENKVLRQPQYICSDHIFALYDAEMYGRFMESHEVSFKFFVVDHADLEPLQCCKVKYCGLQMIPSASSA